MSVEWEVYWTAGYTVRGASDVIVDRYCRTSELASRAADEAAEADKARLIELGIVATIDLWVQRWRTRRVEERDERRPVGEFTSPRRTERVEYERQSPVPDATKHGGQLTTSPGATS